jgi:hypothetical protein
MRLPLTQGLLVGRATQSPVSTNTSITLPASQPAWAEPLSPNLAGFSIEMDRWPLWSGAEVGQPNSFTNQVLQNLADRTGVPPFFRVGGESEFPHSYSRHYCILYSYSDIPRGVRLVADGKP